MQYLERYGFSGGIFPVNPRRREVLGRSCVPNVAALVEVPDMAVIAVPAVGVAEVMRDCQASGVQAQTIYTSGFAEAGGDGEAREAELRDLIADSETLVCGPNSQGVANFLDSMVAYFTSELGSDDAPPGPVGFVSHSGVMGGVVARECIDRGVGAGYLVSLGNEAGISLADTIAYMASDPRIRVVGAYVEGVRDAGALREAISQAQDHGVVVVILKGGRGDAAVRAVASHTSALAGDWATHAAALRQWGAVVVEDLDGMFDALELFALCRARPAGPSIGVITNSGGIGVLCADAATSLGLDIPPLSPDVEASIAERLPAFGSPRNPVDVALQLLTEPERLGFYIETVAGDPGIDIVMPFPGVTRRSVETVVGEIADAAAATDKPVIAGWLGGDPEGPKLLRAASIPAYPTPERAARAARLLLDAVPTPTDMEDGSVDYFDEALTVLSRFRGRCGPLTEQESISIVDACGVHVARAEYAEDAEAAGAAAEKFNGPVALKISSLDLPHKSDAGGVVLNLQGATQTSEAARRMLKTVATRAPDARIDGFLIEEMVSGRVELLVGMHRDDTFGPVVVVGLGGTLVEIAPDRALRVPPFGRSEVRAMLRELRSYAVLESVRGSPPVDIEAVMDVVLRVGALALKAPEIAALDINPLIVSETGAVAADALVVLRS